MNLMARRGRKPEFPDRVPFSEAIRDITGGQPKLQKRDYKSSGRFPVVDQGASLIGGYTDDPKLVANVRIPAILFGDHTKIFKWMDKPFVLGADGVKILEPRHDLDARFAFHFLNTIRLPEDAGYSRHFKFLKRETVPVPRSIDEQRRIAAILDKADAIRRKRRQVLVEMDALLRATFLDRFGDPATNPRGFPLKPMRTFGRVVTGNTPPRVNIRNYGNDIEWIKSDNISAAKYFLTKASEGLSDTGRAIGRAVPAGSTLVTCIAGSPSSIGTAAFADREVAFNQQINALIPFVSTNPHFIFAQIIMAKRLIQMKSSNAMKGMVTKSQFEEVHLMRPPEEQQTRFGGWFARFLAVFRKFQSAADESERAFASLSQRAFHGEL